MDLEAKVVDHLARAAKSRAFKLLSNVRGFWVGAEAAELLLSYKTSLPLHSAKPTDTTIIERRILVKRGDCFYVLGYNAVEEDYAASLPAFENAARTFEFHDGKEKEFRPLVMPVSVPASTLAVAEKREIYKTEG